MMIVPSAHLRKIVHHVETDYPREACGLLVGRRDGQNCHVTRIDSSANLAPEPLHRFEVDPALRFRLMRELRGSDLDIVGHYHSHPDGEAAPSPTDLSMAYEPEMIWLIVAVVGGVAASHAAYALDRTAGRFQPVQLRITGTDRSGSQ